MISREEKTFTKIVPARVNPVLNHADEHRYSLDGDWLFRLDPDERGVTEEWNEFPHLLNDQVLVPGTWQGQGKGSSDTDTVRDFGMRVRVFQATYTGTAWYGKILHIPSVYAGKRIWLNFGGVSPSAEIWLNGIKVGEHHQPFVPFSFEITDIVQPGQECFLAVRVHEADRLLALAYNWQGNWSGLYRGVELTATGPAFFEQVRITADPDASLLTLSLKIGGFEHIKGCPTVKAKIRAQGREGKDILFEYNPESDCSTYEVSVKNPQLWSPDDPRLYRLDLSLLDEGAVIDAVSERFGFVSYQCEGDHLKVNGEPYYWRGTGDFCSCPETGSPDTDRERWRRKLKTLREYGYNYVRCQSYVYSPEYFDAADEVGLVIQSEMGMLGAWGGRSEFHVYQWPQPSPSYRRVLKEQWDNVVVRDVNHPSATMYCMSNEWWDKKVYPRIAWQCYHDTKKIKPNALVIWTDGGYRKDMPGDFINENVWSMRDKGVYKPDVFANCDKPIIQHEFRWWNSYPDIHARHKFKGAVRPFGIDYALERAGENGLSRCLSSAALNSKKLQYIESRGKMEMCRRDVPFLAGLCHFNAMDMNPLPSGIIDDFYEKKLVDAETWRKTNGDTVVLCSLGFGERIFTPGQKLKVEFYVSDFSHPAFHNPELSWKLCAAENDLGILEWNGRQSEGRIAFTHEPYKTHSAGKIEVILPDAEAACRLKLSVYLREDDRVITNDWDIWLFPDKKIDSESLSFIGTPSLRWTKQLAEVSKNTHNGTSAIKDAAVPILTETLDDAVIDYMQKGGRILLAATEGLLYMFEPKFVNPIHTDTEAAHYFFTPPAAYPPFENGHCGTIIQDHPVFAGFPHEGFADLQFYRMIGESAGVEIHPLGLDKEDPIVRVMHQYHVSRPLAYMLEFAYGAGGCLLLSLDLNQEWPEARYLLNEICAYLASDLFSPVMELSDEEVQVLKEAAQYETYPG